MPLLYFQYLRKSRAPLLYFQYLQRSRAPLLRTPVSCGHHGLYKTVTPGLLAGRHGSWPVLARTRGGLLGLLRKTLPSDKRDVSEEKKCLFRPPPPTPTPHQLPSCDQLGRAAMLASVEAVLWPWPWGPSGKTEIGKSLDLSLVSFQTKPGAASWRAFHEVK